MSCTLNTLNYVLSLKRPQHYSIHQSLSQMHIIVSVFFPLMALSFYIVFSKYKISKRSYIGNICHILSVKQNMLIRVNYSNLYLNLYVITKIKFLCKIHKIDVFLKKKIQNIFNIYEQDVIRTLINHRSLFSMHFFLCICQ